MAYTKENYTLYTKTITLRGGRKQPIYFFSKKPENEVKGEPCDLPPNKEVDVNKKTGLPFLRNK